MEFVLLAILLVCGVIYLLPAIIAFRRKHPNRFLIAALNTMTGMTVLGWYFALRAALNAPGSPAAQTTPTGSVAPAAVPRSVTPKRRVRRPPPEQSIFTADIDTTEPVRTQASQPSNQTQRRTKMGFFKAIGTCLGKYAVFDGRASRSEYWWFSLFCGVVFALALAYVGDAAWLAIIPLFLPMLAASIRRLHDIDKSGWYVLVSFIPFGIFVMLYWHVQAGTQGENRFGPDPLLAVEANGVSPIASSVSDKAGQLQKLKSLLDEGTITPDEFDRMKKDVLAG